MIKKVQGNNNTLNFGAIKLKPLGTNVQKVLKSADNFSSVHQKLILGTFGLIVQPAIDLRNKEVDKDTRKISALRSAAKAIIGTATGLVVRTATIKGAELAFSKKGSGGKILDEQKIYRTFKKGFDSLKLDDGKLSDAIKRTPSVIGSLVALGVMIFTNFLVDAPLTNLTMEKLDKLVPNLGNKEKENNETKNG